MSETPEQKLLHLSASPHVRYGDTVPGIMMLVIVALVPSFIASILFFGLRAIVLTCICIISCVATEWAITTLTGKPRTIGDFSAIVTGMLLAFNLPADLPWWMAVLGSVFGIGMAKMVFGGLGHNFINPALAGRAFLMASYPAAMTAFPRPAPPAFIDSLSRVTGVDAGTYATPLAYLKSASQSADFSALNLQDSLGSLFWGNVGGCIGETSAFALLLGALLLWYKRIIGFNIPLTFIGTVFVLTWLFNGTGSFFTSEALIIPFYHVFAGGLMLGALFMATDMVTTPIMPLGKILFGAGCGTLTFVIRKFGGYPEGVSYSILLMNIVTPLLDRHTRPRRYGEGKKRD